MDIAILEWITAHRPESLNSFFLTVTELGSEFIPILLLAVVCWCLDRRYSTRVLLTIMFSLIANQFLKLVFLVKRPWLRSDKIIPVEEALSGATGYSFPSGHTANITACAGSVSALKVPIWFKIISWVLVFLVAISRLFLCVHTPTDVIVSFLVTLLIVFLTGKLSAFIEKKPDSVLPVAIAAIASIAVVIVLAYVQPENGTGTRSDILKLSGACVGAMLSWCIFMRRIAYCPAKNIKSVFLRVIPGLVLLLLVLEGTKPLFISLIGTEAGGCVRYLLTTFVALTVWPYIFYKAGF